MELCPPVAGYWRYQGARAKQELMLAVQIAAGKLNRIQTQVNEVTR